MNVLELCTSPDSGGLELYMLRTSAALAAAGDSVFAVVGANSSIHSRLSRLNVEVVSLVVHFNPFPLMAARQLAQLIDTRQIDAIHLHWGRDLPLAALAKHFSKRSLRLVYTRHMRITRNKKDIYHRWLYRQVDVLLSITETMAFDLRQCLEHKMSARVHTLYHGAPGLPSMGSKAREQLRQRWNIPDDAKLVGIFSRIERPKGQHLLVEALCRGRDEGVTMYALFVGHVMDQGYLADLQARITAQALDDYVHFEGFSDDVQRWMQACDIVALTTRDETFGLVLIEAMRAGVAVIGSDRGGVPEIIHHEQNGLLFRSFDADDFYTQLLRLLVDQGLRHKLAVSAKQDADTRFNDDIHFRALRGYLFGAF